MIKQHWRRRRLLAGIAALALTATPPQAAAQRIVLDPSNLAQNVLQAARSLEQITHQIRQIEQQAAMLARSPLELGPELSRDIAEAEALLEAGGALSFEASRIAEDLRLLYPEAYDAFALDEAIAQSEAWLAQSRASLELAVGAQARAHDQLTRQHGQLSRALAASSAASGQTSAMQAGNQVLGVMAAQLVELQLLIAAEGRALAAERMERIAREDRADAIQRRAFPQRRRALAGARTAF